MPRIIGASRSGKKLFVTGENFDTGAKIIVNEVEQKTSYNSSASLTGKKAGKTIRPGDRVRVRNSDGSFSPEHIYP